MHLNQCDVYRTLLISRRNGLISTTNKACKKSTILCLITVHRLWRVCWTASSWLAGAGNYNKSQIAEEAIDLRQQYADWTVVDLVWEAQSVAQNASVGIWRHKGTWLGETEGETPSPHGNCHTEQENGDQTSLTFHFFLLPDHSEQIKVPPAI